VKLTRRLQGYSSEATLTITQQFMLRDLHNLGLVFHRSKKHTTFYPTPLATTLTSGAMVVTNKGDEAGFIVLETNYRLYAYTQSPLQIAVLALFTDLKARFKNMVVGMITRESVREAFGHGITAQQIVAYLTAHAHPMLRKENPVLPPSVLDQLRLWELERNRLKVWQGYVYSTFSSEKELDDIAKYADTIGGLVARKDGKTISLEKKLLFIRDDRHGAVRDFIKRRNKSGN
jgi:transcription initiation factor TFIIH subunit 4